MHCFLKFVGRNLAGGCGMDQKKGYWRNLCELVACEMDSKKLLELTEKLIKVLEEEVAAERAAQKGSIPSSSSG